MRNSEYALLLDFGASRIKSCVVEVRTGEFSHFKSEPSLPNHAQIPGHFEVSAKALAYKFRSLCDFYLNELNLPIQQVRVCSEMHGFLVADAQGRLLTDFISWKDQRSLEVDHPGVSTYQQIEEDLGHCYKEITGMRLRPSIPLVNCLQLARSRPLPSECILLSLTDWLVQSAVSDPSDSIPKFVTTYESHESMSAGLGIYDLKKKILSPVLSDYFKEKTGVGLMIHPVSTQIKAWGFLRGTKVPVYSGVGDHPCAVLGAGNIGGKTVSVNIGTGSQVALIDFLSCCKNAEYRPYFGGSRLTTITHIPAGRALSVYIRFLESIGQTSNSPQSQFWDLLQKLSLEEVEASKLKVNLSIFPGAWNYGGGGSIDGISESNWNVKSYLAGLIRALSTQYHQVIEDLDPERKVADIVLGGGIPQKLTVLGKLLEKQTGRRVIPPKGGIEETLRGLYLLAVGSNGIDMETVAP